MKRIIAALLLSIPFITHAQASDEALETMTFDGINRNFLLYVPENLPENASLVMVFHGYSGTAAYARSYFNMETLANENGFVLVYPQGTKDKSNYNFWQVGYKGHQDLEVNDVSFAIQLAEHLQAKYNLNKANTFIAGFSNGGDLCNKLICERPEFFKATAPIISCMMKEMMDGCADVKGVPTFMLNGTKDNITYWAGDMEDKQGYGPYHSTDSMLAFRIQQNNAVLASTESIASTKESDKTSVTVKKYQSASNNNQVWMYQVNEGGHGHPDYFSLEEHVWKFFSLYLEK